MLYGHYGCLQAMSGLETSVSNCEVMLLSVNQKGISDGGRKYRSSPRILVISDCCSMDSYSQATNTHIENIRSKQINKPTMV